MSTERMRVGIIGAGAMGTLFGYHLAQTCDVTVLDSNAELLAKISRDGLRVNDEPARMVTVARRTSDLFSVGALFLFVKAVDTLRALRPFASELDPSTPVISLQNGLGNDDAIKTALGGSVPVILGITTESALSSGPGHSLRTSDGNTLLGSAGAAAATSKMIADLLTKSALKAAVVYDIRPHLWGKLIANASVNALSALLDCSAGDILRDANAAHLAESLAEEAAAVAAASDIKLPFANPWHYVSEVIRIGADAKSSMAFDLFSKHPSEIDYINGAICASGRRCGMPTPYNDAMVRLIKAHESLSS